MKPFRATYTPRRFTKESSLPLPFSDAAVTVLVIAVTPGTDYVPSGFLYIAADGTPDEAELSYFSQCHPEWPREIIQRGESRSGKKIIADKLRDEITDILAQHSWEHCPRCSCELDSPDLETEDALVELFHRWGGGVYVESED